MSDRPKVFYGWVVVATAALGLFLGAFPIVAFSFGVFFPSFVREFHASRAEISLAFTIHNFLSGIFAVVVGRIADRSGARYVILPGLLIVATLLLSAEAIGSRLSELYLFYIALGVVGSATTTRSLRPGGVALVRPAAGIGARWNDGGAGPRGGRDADRRATADRELRLAKRVRDRRLRELDDSAADRRPFLKDAPAQIGLLPDGASPDETALSRRGSGSDGIAWHDARQSGTFWLLIAVFRPARGQRACVRHSSAAVVRRSWRHAPRTPRWPVRSSGLRCSSAGSDAAIFSIGISAAALLW